MAVTNFDNVLKGIDNKTEKQIIASNKPLIYELEVLYGNRTMIDILYAYLFKFQTLLNLKDEVKMNSEQLEVCAKNIIPFLRGLTLSEVVYMFQRFSSGEFGKFYGQIDIMTIGEWVREFKRKRGDFILKNKDVRNFLIKRDQNYDENNVSWLNKSIE